MFGCGQLIEIPRAVNVVRPRRSIRSGVGIVRKTLGRSIVVGGRVSNTSPIV